MRTSTRVSCLSILPLLSLAATLHAASLPDDWLVNPAPFKARVLENKEKHELVLENGLARRVFQLTPNAACVSLENLTSREHLLRAIAPEARVTLNGTEFAIGGLTGAPIANYIDPTWRDQLRPIPNSYQFVGWKEEPVKPRFGWKKRPEWLARDLPWPPPGKHVVMRYHPPASAPASLGGKVLVEDDFSKINDGRLNPDWKVLKAEGFDRASFSNEGKVGEVMARSAAATCAERAWPAGAQSVEVIMDSGDDASDAWGPGLAVVHEERVSHLITNPGTNSYSANGKKAGKFTPSQPCTLRVRHADGQLYFEASQAGASHLLIGTIACPKPPLALRVGKVGINGSGTDAGNDQTVIRCHISKVTFRAPETTKPAARTDLPIVDVHYEIYDGIPLISKWLVVSNPSTAAIRLNRFTAEELRLAELETAVNETPTYERHNIHVETDFAFGDMTIRHANPAVQLISDPVYPTQAHYGRQTPCLLTATPPQMGPDADIAPGASFESFRVFDLLLDSSERERRSLAMRRMYRTIAPWTAQNPSMFHKLGSDPKTVRDAIDQAAEVGFDMVIMSFGSGFNFESRDEKYIARYKELVDYGKSKGVVLGGYSLLASRGAGTPAENTQGSRARYGVMPCLGAKWGRDYLAQIRTMCEKTGLGVFENDGSYPGDRCSATDHPHHHGLEDSQWVQWRAMTDLYKWCCENSIYLNIPDWYYLTGAPKCGMGYRETNYSLPREQQVVIERQVMFDGTWERTASMGWMFLPLSQYHGGGAASTIEPLDQHRDHYNERFADLLGYGVQACFRGPRLYDTEATKAIVKKWVSFYKSHREVLDGDIIHLRRPNGQDWDGIVHVNPLGKEKAMAFFYNPLNEDITREIRIPLYYAGLTGKSQVSIGGAAAQTVALDKTESVTLRVTIPARSHQWLLFTAAR